MQLVTLGTHIFSVDQKIDRRCMYGLLLLFFGVVSAQLEEVLWDIHESLGGEAWSRAYNRFPVSKRWQRGTDYCHWAGVFCCEGEDCPNPPNVQGKATQCAIAHC